MSNLKKKALGSLDKLPPFSPTLSRLLATLSSGDVSFAKLADLLEKDAVLAGNVLSLVNSGLYGRGGRVNSVRHAVALLGVSKLRNAALGMSVARMWSKVSIPAPWSMASFNQHSIATAILADLLSQELDVEYGEGAFVSGLLHDVGRLLIGVTMPDLYASLERYYQAHPNSTGAECERELLGFTQAELSADALRIWNLPEPMQEAVRNHDQPIAAEAGRRIPLSSALTEAENYVNRADIRLQSKCPMPCNEPGPLFLQLGARLPRLLETFHSEFECIRGFF